MLEALTVGLVLLAFTILRRNAYRQRWSARLAKLKERIN